MSQDQLELRYGMNPHQAPARVHGRDGMLPIEVRNGQPGFINLLDALNAWQLVLELKEATGLAAAASFKHVSPAGAAVAVPLPEDLRRSYFIGDVELTPLASAYARARGADRVSSYGDWVACSDAVDEATARLLQVEVSDGIIAPGYQPEALEILRSKQQGRYRIVEVDAGYRPQSVERRDVFGLTFEQRRNDAHIDAACLDQIVTTNRDLSAEGVRDLLVAMIAVKYTQSNSITLALDGQVIGVGAGQQSRVHCVRLAAAKADAWHLRRHPEVLGLRFREGIGRPDMNNAIDGFLRDDLTEVEQRYWSQAYFDTAPQRLDAAARSAWLSGLDRVAMASDAYFPFRDSIDRAAASGVRYVSNPGGSARDAEVAAACDEYGIVMCTTGLRLFHH